MKVTQCIGQMKVTQCIGHVSANTRLHKLRWGDREWVYYVYMYPFVVTCMASLNFLLKL